MNDKVNAERIEKLKKNIETVMCWRKFGRPLNKEQQAFADRVAEEMIALRNMNKVGVQLVSRSKIDFIRKGMQPVQDSDRVGPTTQDAVATGPAKNGKFPRKTEEKEKVVTKVSKPSNDPSAKESLPVSDAKDGNFPKSSPDIKNIKTNPPEGCKCGQVHAVADSKTDPKTLTPDDKEPIAIEEIGHQPNLPMPKKMAEELVSNAEYGVEIGAYSNVKEGIDRLLGRKEYTEFIDTDDKLKAVITYLKGLIKE